MCACVSGLLGCRPPSSGPRNTYRVLVTWWLVAVLLWSVCSFRITDAGDVANDDPLSLIVWWRPDQDRRPLRWVLQAHLSTSCTRRHIIEVRSFRLSAGVFLWDPAFDTASVPCCMLAVGMSVCWLKQVVIVGFVVLAAQLGVERKLDLLAILNIILQHLHRSVASRRPSSLGLTWLLTYWA